MQKKRDDNARRRCNFNSNATAQEKEAQREYERNKKRQQRASETPQQREVRLRKMREYKARLSTTEEGTEKTASKFCYTSEYDRIQRKIQRERETSEQREERLLKAREYKETYKPKATPKQKEAKREQMAASRANRSEEQIAKDREAARQRMANVRSRIMVDEEPNPGTSGKLYAPRVDIPEDMCEYDQIRQKNIEERQRKFKELGLNEAKSSISNADKLAKKVKSSQTGKGGTGGKE